MAHKKKLFAHSFAIVDLDTVMYTASGSSMKSEGDAHDRAIKPLSQ